MLHLSGTQAADLVRTLAAAFVSGLDFAEHRDDLRRVLRTPAGWRNPAVS